MTSDNPSIDPKNTALVLIDLQKGIVARDTAPYGSADVVARCARMADRFRARGAIVVLVHVGFSPDGGDMLKQPVDNAPGFGIPPADWDEFVPEIGPRPGDLIVRKHNWGAFHGTDLDLQLRRRGIAEIVLGGIASNIGVESTARQAHELNYRLILVEDAMTDLLAEGHAHATRVVFPRIGRVRSTEQVLAALED